MRQLNNKHLDTTEGASAHQGEIVSSQFAPSCQKDENQMKKSNHINFHTRESLYTGAKETLYKLDDKLNNINVLNKKQELIESIKDILLEVKTEVDHITWAEEVIRENEMAEKFGYYRTEPECFLFEYEGMRLDQWNRRYANFATFFRCRIYKGREHGMDGKWILEVNSEKVFTSHKLLDCLETHKKVIKSIQGGSYKRILWSQVDKLQKKYGFFNDYIQ